MKLSGSRVWITGASSGIGAALATELVARGADVAISARREDKLRAVAGKDIIVVPLDITDHDAVQRAADEVRAQLGGIDMMVLNAGAWTQTDIRHWDADAFRTQVEVNLLGTSSCLAAVLPQMIERGAGTIVIVASVAGYRGIPGSEAYGATKAALLNLAESMRADLAPAGVTVQAVSPGFVRTEMTEVNDFPMPFIVDVDEAARSIADGLETSRPEIVFPFRMAATMKTLQLLPQRLWTLIWSRQSSLR